MTLNERIEALEKLNEALNTDSDAYKKVRKNAYLNNKWFIENNIDMAINAIKSEFLEKSKIENWLSAYDIPDNPKSKKTGIIMAGNIPLVGFHDLMSVFISGNIALVKLSSKDTLLMEYVIGLLYKINPQIENYIKIEERLNDIDAIIATGSNNSFRYFEYYFGKHPHIIRKNRNGVAVLTGNESDDDLQSLTYDILDYFGLGCRNISKIYVPENYDFAPLMKALDKHQYLKEHNKYMNNYDYNLAISLINKDKIYQNDVIFLKEDISYLSRIASVHFEEYNHKDEVINRLKNDEELIQVVATKSGEEMNFEREVPFGTTQSPTLSEYADGVDTMKFLLSL